jgi:hypothetical protein
MTQKNSISIIYSTTKESLASQQTQKSVLETKSNTLIGFAGAMIALLLGARDSIQSMQSIARNLVFVSISLFLFSILLATFVGWVRKYRSDPHPNTLADHYLDKSEQDVQLQLIANLIDAWKDNSRQLERNALILRIALSAQTLAFIMLGIVLIWSLV